MPGRRSQPGISGCDLVATGQVTERPPTGSTTANGHSGNRTQDRGHQPDWARTSRTHSIRQLSALGDRLVLPKTPPLAVVAAAGGSWSLFKLGRRTADESPTVRRGPSARAVIEQLELPTTNGLQPMMSPTKTTAVRRRCRTFWCWGRMIDIAMCRVSTTARESTSTIPRDDEIFQLLGRAVDDAAVVEEVAGYWFYNQPPPLGVDSEFASNGRQDRAVSVELSRILGKTEQTRQIDHDVDLSVASVARWSISRGQRGLRSRNQCGGTIRVNAGIRLSRRPSSEFQPERSLCRGRARPSAHRPPTSSP